MVNRHFVGLLLARLGEKKLPIQLVLGPRQVGKTTGIRSLMLLYKGQSHFVTADQITPPDAYWLLQEWRKAQQLPKGSLFIVDEVQKIPRWAEIIKQLFDEQTSSGEHLKIILLGSSSLLLSHDSGESLAGRFEVIEVSHWSYSEMKELYNLSLEEYLQYGGYPDLSSPDRTRDPERWHNMMRQALIDPVISKDLQEQVEINKPALFRQTAEIALRSPAQVIGYSKILGQLQDRGNATTVRHYLELLEKAYFIKLINKYSGTLIRQRVSSPKIVPLAGALISAYEPTNRFTTDLAWRGKIIEAAIGAHLSKTKGKLFYWSEGDFEVDYVLELAGKLFAVEVKAGPARRSNSIGKLLRKYPKAIPCTIAEDSVEKFLLQDDVDNWFKPQG